MNPLKPKHPLQRPAHYISSNRMPSFTEMTSPQLPQIAQATDQLPRRRQAAMGLPVNMTRVGHFTAWPKTPPARLSSSGRGLN